MKTVLKKKCRFSYLDPQTQQLKLRDAVTSMRVPGTGCLGDIPEIPGTVVLL